MKETRIMKMRQCGGDFVYCDGECASCPGSDSYTSDASEEELKSKWYYIATHDVFSCGNCHHDEPCCLDTCPKCGAKMEGVG